jgi:hypothetical protein
MAKMRMSFPDDPPMRRAGCNLPPLAKAAMKVCWAWAWMLHHKLATGKFDGLTHHVDLNKWRERMPWHRLNAFVEWADTLPGDKPTPSADSVGECWLWAIDRVADRLDKLSEKEAAREAPAPGVALADLITTFIEHMETFRDRRHLLESYDFLPEPADAAECKALMAELENNTAPWRQLSPREEWLRGECFRMDNLTGQARADARKAGELLADAMDLAPAATLDSAPLRTFLRALEPAPYSVELWPAWTALCPTLEKYNVRLRAGMLTATAPPADKAADGANMETDPAAPYYPPEHYREVGIDDDRLRKARAAGKLAAIRSPRSEKRWWYSEPGARALWPECFRNRDGKP